MRRPEVIEVVARDLAQQLRKACLDFPFFPLVETLQLPHELAVFAASVRHRAEAPLLAGDRDRVDRKHVVHHVAVLDRARATRIISRHPAERRLRAGRDVDREPEAAAPQLRVQRIEHHAGLDQRGARLLVDFQNAVEVLAVVDDQRFADGLPALRAARAARQDRHALLLGNRNRGPCRLFAARHNHADRLHLVDRSVGGIAAAACGIEQDLAVELLGEARCEGVHLAK